MQRQIVLKELFIYFWSNVVLRVLFVLLSNSFMQTFFCTRWVQSCHTLCLAQQYFDQFLENA